ncbi:stage 0 sporulation regulatory protein [Oikeobacillus pervagus]|uniref:Stage 0 sporulation regulatory protein n=1 Tax=Oikeobacillus pervagus TaxID=1325931 RepID=A0AAJ1SZS0_9BACI|nr:aspartyl-phosphate phosphatase Spo0E family protein [Oikeobacillus pervagus]MDQ0214662.1 stage 0 sporulation regulatory protein [Oikeobacillus pervagus]
MSREKLLKQIENKRNELIGIVANNGLNSPIAIQYSQELDSLLNDYNRLYIKKSSIEKSLVTK